MYDFIFLGIIPGTHLRVTFATWLCIAGLLTAGYILRRLHTARQRSATFRWPAMRHKFYAARRQQAVRG